MKKALFLLAIALIGLPTTAWADTFTFQAPATAPNEGEGGPNQMDLDHHKAYAWRIDNVNLQGKTITEARLTFSNIRNWDRNPNMLFIHLLDTANRSGIRAFVDARGTPVPVTQILDNFSGSLPNTNPLITPGLGNTFLTSRSLATTPTTFVYNFTADQLQLLNTFFLNGNNVAFGFDPDCHFWNDGIKFELTTSDPVPEPATMLLLGSGLAGMYLKRRRRKAVASASKTERSGAGGFPITRAFLFSSGCSIPRLELSSSAPERLADHEHRNVRHPLVAELISE